MPVAKSVLKPLIENGNIPWYDDPRLPTLDGIEDVEESDQRL